jgi:leader peptidase (prepilin peptidase)/N-methyltransferase
MLTLAFVDATVLRLPHRLALATTAGTIPLLAAAAAPGSSCWHTILGAAALAGFYALVHIVSRGGLGLGDVTVAVPIGIALGWLDWHLIIAAVLLGHTLAAVTIPIRRFARNAREPLPLGTYLVIASYAVIVAAGIR